MKVMITELKFKCIDDWNRPIFKLVDKDKKYNFPQYFCALDKLFNWGVSGEEVLKTVTEEDITYFGTSYDCDPLGTRIKADKIKLIP